MGFLTWIGGIVLFLWVLGLVFSVGGVMIHWLLVIAAIAFVVDMVTRRSKV